MPLEVAGILPPLYISAYFMDFASAPELRDSLFAIGRRRDDGRLAVGRPCVFDLPGRRRSSSVRRVADGCDAPCDRAPARGATPLIDIIEGEPLNDGTLVLLRTAIAAAVAGSFSLWHAEARSWSTSSGIAVGLAVGYVIRRVRRALDNPPLEVTIAFLTGYFAFLPASALGVPACLRSSPPASTWAGTPLS
jgi:hypothetical protein